MDGAAYSAAGESSVVLSSARVGWRSPLAFEVHRMVDAAYAEHRLVDHRLIVNLGAPLRFGWHVGDRPQEKLLPTGGLCLQSDDEGNATFWREEMTFAAVAIPLAMVEALLDDAPMRFLARRRSVNLPYTSAAATGSGLRRFRLHNVPYATTKGDGVSAVPTEGILHSGDQAPQSPHRLYVGSSV